MRFPEINSRGMLILQTLRARPMTIHQAIEAHGEFATARRPQGVDYVKIVALYCDLVERKCLVKEGIKYRLTLAARYRLEAMDRPAVPLQVAAPRVRDIWSGQLVGYGAKLVAQCHR